MHTVRYVPGVTDGVFESDRVKYTPRTEALDVYLLRSQYVVQCGFTVVGCGCGAGWDYSGVTRHASGTS